MSIRATKAIDSWIRVCLTLFAIYLVGVFMYCMVAFISPTTVKLQAFTLVEFFAFMAFGAISFAWWGVPIFVAGAALIWIVVNASDAIGRRIKR